MSQLNVNTIGARTGTTVSVASGNSLLDGSGDTLTPSGLVKISAVTSTSDSSIIFDNVFTSDYQFYEMYMLMQPSTTADFRLTWRSGGSSGSDLTGNHDSRYYYIAGGSGWTAGTQQANSNYCTIFNGGGATSDYGMKFSIWNPQLSTERTSGFMYGSWKDGGQLHAGFSHDSLTEVTGIKLYCSTGNIVGNFTLFGVRK